MKIKDLKASPPNICLYGEFGTGKTAFGLTCPGLRILSFEGDNLRVGATLEDKLTSVREEADIEEFSDQDPTKPIGFEKFKARLGEIAKEVEDGSYKNKSLGLDSMTALLDSATRAILRRSGKSPINGNLSQPEWGVLFKELKSIVMQFKVLPIPTFMILHESVITVNDMTVRKMALPGKAFPAEIPRLFSEIWYCTVKKIGDKKQFVIQPQSTDVSLSRSNSNLPAELDMNLGMGEVLRKAGYVYPDPS